MSLFILYHRLWRLVKHSLVVLRTLDVFELQLEDVRFLLQLLVIYYAILPVIRDKATLLGVDSRYGIWRLLWLALYCLKHSDLGCFVALWYTWGLCRLGRFILRVNKWICRCKQVLLIRTCFVLALDPKNVRLLICVTLVCTAFD